MTKRKFDKEVNQAYEIGFRRGYEIANRIPIDKGISKDEFVDIVLQEVANSRESTAFVFMAAKIDLMNEKNPEFDGWTIFDDALIQGAGENFTDRTGT
jgi:hypothetical protein